MNSSPVIDRQYAYFHATGLFDPVEMTRIIGAEPSDYWAAGEEFARRGHPLRRQTSKWTLHSGLDETKRLSEHVDCLLHALVRHRAGLLEAATMAKLQIVCVGYCAQSFGWDLEVEHMRLASALNVGFSFDAYVGGDPHEEMVAMREQLGIRKKRSDD